VEVVTISVDYSNILRTIKDRKCYFLWTNTSRIILFVFKLKE